MAIEYELKFRGTEAILAALAETMSGPPAVYEMRTTYYDTPTGQLSARHYTLRCRMENQTAVCTIKAPTHGRGRGEWELEEADIYAAIPELCKLGGPSDLPALCAEGLLPICGAEFTRRAWSIPLEGGAVELALDQGFLSGGGRRQSLCEIEVELKAGPPELCLQYARLLAHRFDLKPETGSKFRRALALYRGEQNEHI